MQEGQVRDIRKYLEVKGQNLEILRGIREFFLGIFWGIVIGMTFSNGYEGNISVWNAVSLSVFGGLYIILYIYEKVNAWNMQKLRLILKGWSINK